VPNNRKTDVIILGAGLAGLAAGHALSRNGRDILVIERDPGVGGLAKTVHHAGFRFDIGGHRFKTTNPSIENLVTELMGSELLQVKRSSKILLRGKYFDYPLKPLNAFFGFGIPTATRILTDYLLERFLRARKNVPLISLQDWVVHNFGRTLFDIYFREYSEKIWGLACQEICMEWVQQRIQGLSLGLAIKHAFYKSAGRHLRTLANTFLYPPLGIGQIAEKFAAEIRRKNDILTSSRIMQIRHNGNRITGVVVQNGDTVNLCHGSEFISSIPLTTFVQLLNPKPPLPVLNTAAKLRYRDLVVVTVMIDRARVTDQTWIYIPEHSIPFGRIHEPTNWSPEMAPEGKTHLVTEHFCFRGDSTWSASDQELVTLTVTSLESLGFIKRHEVIDSVVLRIPNAYPLFEVGYAKHCEILSKYVEGFSNLVQIGRGGLFKYYNMDHAIESGIEAADMITGQHNKPDCSIQAEILATGTRP